MRSTKYPFMKRFLSALSIAAVVSVWLSCTAKSTTGIDVTTPQSAVTAIPSPKVDQSEIAFEPLAPEENLVYKIDVTGTAPNRMSLTVYAVGKTKRELLMLSGSFIGDQPTQYGKATGMIRDSVNKNVGWLAVQIMTGKDSSSNDVAEIWFVNGVKGKAKRILAGQGFDFMVDEQGKIICVYDGAESELQNVPTFALYDIETMRLTKRFQYEPFRGLSIDPTKLTFKDNSFTATLADDGPNNAVVNIPVGE